MFGVQVEWREKKQINSFCSHNSFISPTKPGLPLGGADQPFCALSSRSCKRDTDRQVPMLLPTPNPSLQARRKPPLSVPFLPALETCTPPLPCSCGPKPYSSSWGCFFSKAKNSAGAADARPRSSSGQGPPHIPTSSAPPKLCRDFDQAEIEPGNPAWGFDIVQCFIFSRFPLRGSPTCVWAAVSPWKGLFCSGSVFVLEAFSPAEKLKVVTGASFWGESLGFYYLNKINDNAVMQYSST